MSDLARAASMARLGRAAPWLATAVVGLGLALTSLRFGAPAAVLWLAFCTLTGALLLFWEGLRVALDPAAEGDPVPEPGHDTSEIAARKRAALRALKELDFEHSIGRITDADRDALRTRYRAEARAAIEAEDARYGGYLPRAEALLDEVMRADAEPVAPIDADAAPTRAPRDASRAAAAGESEPMARRICAACEASNEPDAAFCKRCGAKVGTT